MSFIKAWGLVILSLCYTFFVAKLVPKGITRLILIIPVFLIFFIVPFLISSVQLIGTTAFFITWLANFKLFLFAFGRGPLSPNSKPLSLPVFLALSCFPIKIQSTPKPTTSQSLGSRDGPLSYTIKTVLLVLVINAYGYSSRLPGTVMLTLYAIHIYCSLELILAATAAMVRAMSDLELEPQFNEPYLATSLQDFWGRRWNLMVPGILRPTVYQPTVQLFSGLGGNWSRVLAVFGTFAVSGIMHELIFFYMGRVKPDWKLTWFFLINGVCTTVEIVIKKAVNGKWRFPTVVSRFLTLGFVMVTSLWLFFPEFDRCNIYKKTLEEYAAISAVATEIRRNINASLF